MKLTCKIENPGVTSKRNAINIFFKKSILIHAIMEFEET